MESDWADGQLLDGQHRLAARRCCVVREQDQAGLLHPPMGGSGRLC